MIITWNHWRDGFQFLDLLYWHDAPSNTDTTPPVTPSEYSWDTYNMTNANVTLPSMLVEKGVFKAMPTTATDICTDTCAVTQLIVQNPTAGAITFTVADKASSPLTVWNAKSVGAGGEYVFRASEGAWFTNGITVSSSAPGLVYSIVIFQET